MSFKKFASSKKKKFTNFDVPRPSGSVIGPPRKQSANDMDADDSNPNSFKTNGIGDLAGKLGNAALGTGMSTGFDKFKKKRAAGAAY